MIDSDLSIKSLCAGFSQCVPAAAGRDVGAEHHSAERRGARRRNPTVQSQSDRRTEDRR